MQTQPQSNIDFLIMPGRVAMSKKLNANAKLVFSLLWFFTKRGDRPARASIRTIAKHTGLSKDQVNRAVHDLEEWGSVATSRYTQKQMTTYRCATEDDFRLGRRVSNLSR